MPSTSMLVSQSVSRLAADDAWKPLVRFRAEAAFDMNHLFLNTEGHPLKRNEL